eukprot:g4537.t1
MSAISFRHSPEFDSYAAGTEHTIDLLITVIAESEVDSGRAPLRVSAALDRSSSMSGRKLNLLKNTMNFVLRQVEETDKLGIVSYGTTVTEELVLKASDTASKRSGAAALQNIRARETTNLSGGLFRSIEQVKEDAKNEDETNPGPVNCVLLLTDGLANQGITDPAALEEAAVKALEGYPPIKLHTFGYGPDHNARLLQRLAEIGGGNFYFIDEDESVPTAFADAIGGLLSVVVQNVSFELRPASNVITIEKVFTGFRTTRNDIDGSVKILCNDLYSKERKDVIVRMKVPALLAPSDAQPILEACLKYFDVSNGKTTSTEAVVSVKRPNVAPEGQTANEELLEQRLRVNVYETMEEAAELAAQGQNREAAHVLRRSFSQLSGQASTQAFGSVQAQLSLAEQQLVNTTTGRRSRQGESILLSQSRSLKLQRGSNTYRSDLQKSTVSDALTYVSGMDPVDSNDTETDSRANV